MGLLFQIILSLNLLLFHFPSSHYSQPLCLPNQSSALLQFKTSFTGNTDYISSACNQSYPKTTTWENVTDCCSWLGVTCHPISGHVTGLDLRCSGLQGKLPSLSCLDMSNNKLNGRIPNWLPEIDSLQILNLSQNVLTASIDQFSGNYRLSVLDLSFNLLAADITSLICNLSSLVLLDLSHNKLTGIIPQCLVNLQSLQVLDLHMNKLHGSLPLIFPKNNKLSDMNLSENQLKGPLPTSLSKCTQLQVLNLGNNQIEDTFPHWLQKLPNLRVLVLRANKFHSPITSSNTKHLFPSLTILDISGNNFSGSLPIVYIENFEAMKNSAESESDLQYVEFKYIIYGDRYEYYSQSYDSMVVTMKGIDLIFTKIPTILVTMDLSANNFEGKIPDVLGKLHALRGLNLSHNGLVGTIPRSLGNLTNLESLDLSSNMLLGGIPMELTNLNYLAVLNLSHNHLVGEVPQGKQFNTFSNESYEGNMGLCGVPLSTKCDMNCGQCSSDLTLWSEEKFGFGWKPVAIGYGCGVVFGVAQGCCVLLMGKPQWLVRMVEVQPTKRVTRKTRMGPRGRMNVQLS
ncbi:Receptor-like protein 12, partial [Mucuna pruriens]